MAAQPEKPMHPMHKASQKATAGKQADAQGRLAKCQKPMAK